MRQKTSIIIPLLFFTNSLLNADILTNEQIVIDNELVKISTGYSYDISSVEANLYFKKGEHGGLKYEASTFHIMDQKNEYSHNYNILLEPKDSLLPKISLSQNKMESEFTDSSDTLKYDTFMYKTWKNSDQEDVKPTINIKQSNTVLGFEKDLMKLFSNNKQDLEIDLGYKYHTMKREITLANEAMRGYYELDPNTGENILTVPWYNEEGELHPGVATILQEENYHTMSYAIYKYVTPETKIGFSHIFDLGKRDDNEYHNLDYKAVSYNTSYHDFLNINLEIFKNEDIVDKSEFKNQGIKLGTSLKF